MLRDRYEFQYQLDHLLSCPLGLFFSLNEFSMFFFLGAFVSLSWFGTSSQLVVFCLVFWDMFIDHDYLFTPYTYHGLNTPFFV